MSYSNDHCQLCFHRQSLKGAVLDYVIHFNHTTTDLMVEETFELFEKLHNTLDFYKARLIAECEYIRINEEYCCDLTQHTSKGL